MEFSDKHHTIHISVTLEELLLSIVYIEKQDNQQDQLIVPLSQMGG